MRTGLAGSGALHFAVFAAFVTLYPNVQFFLRIPAKWVFLILAAIGTLSALAAHDWQDLVVFCVSIALAFFFIELNGAGPELAWWNAVKERFTPKPKFHVLPKPRVRTGGSRSESEEVSIDRIFDKINKFGRASLTPSELRQLERERQRLLNSE
jgi:hypothetical protein